MCQVNMNNWTSKHGWSGYIVSDFYELWGCPFFHSKKFFFIPHYLPLLGYIVGLTFASFFLWLQFQSIMPCSSKNLEWHQALILTF